MNFSAARRIWTGVTAVLALVALLGLSGCALLQGERTRTVSSSVVDFLYPERAAAEMSAQAVTEAPVDAVPQLRLPLRVGLMFVPSRGGYGSDTEAPGEALKTELLQRVRVAFKDRPYIGEIVLVPEAYLRSGKDSGFRTLEQLGRMYGFDVAALVSYDQLTTSVDSNWSVLYLTVVGAYAIPARQHAVSTFVDTAVFDLRTRKLLLRAPGLHQLERRSTPVEDGKVVQAAQTQSLRIAMDDMTTQLAAELGVLEQRLRDGDAPLRVVDAQGWAAGGAGVALLLTLAAAALLRRRLRPWR